MSNTATLHLAGCVLKDGSKRVLLLHRNKKGVRQWELPGGKLEKGEEAEVAAIREIKEELGVDVRIVARLGEASFVENGMTCIYSWYGAELADENDAPSICEPQTFDGLRYWDPADLESRADLSANLRNLLKSDVLEQTENV